MAKEAVNKKFNLDISTYSDMRCPMHGMLSLLSGPWTTYILWLMRNNDEMRFGQIKKQIPNISAKMLTERLKMLEGAGIISRHAEAVIPPKVTYKFTERGHQLEDLLDKINSLAQQWSGSKSDCEKQQNKKSKNRTQFEKLK